MGPSGGLECHDGTIDIVPAVIPRTVGVNHFHGLSLFESGLIIDTDTERTPKEQRPKCKEEERGALWFQRSKTTKDSMQVCMWDGAGFEWARMELRAEP